MVIDDGNFYTLVTDWTGIRFKPHTYTYSKLSYPDMPHRFLPEGSQRKHWDDSGYIGFGSLANSSKPHFHCPAWYLAIRNNLYNLFF